jgi:hypothetical protein
VTEYMGDPRQCNLHPGQVTSSPDGMFDTPCPVCEYEADMGPDGPPPQCRECGREDSLRDIEVEDSGETGIGRFHVEQVCEDCDRRTK